MKEPFSSPRLRFEEFLGQGGTAHVARVYCHDLERVVAAKYPFPGGDAGDFLHLAEREYHLIGSASFPGLVRLLDKPNTNPPFLLLDLCTGPTLDQIDRIDDVPRALSLCSALAVNLEYLHASGIIHGDIKPHNFFLPESWAKTAPDSLYYTRLSDFSLGRLFDEPEDARSGVGTVGYTAPEVLEQDTTSHRSDLFALGVIFYRLLTGEHPFLKDGADPVRVNSRMKEGNYAPLGTIRPDLPEVLGELIDNMLAANPSSRPSSAWDVCRTLHECGSVYPYTQALRPAHLWRRTGSFDNNITSTLESTDTQRHRIELLTDKNNNRLRLLLTANFVRGGLAYSKGRFVFKSEVIWPSCLRRSVLAQFSAMVFGDKKQSVRAALQGDSSHNPEGALPYLLRGLVRPVTARRLSPALARKAETEENWERAARLYLQAGMLEKAEQLAEQAAVDLHHRNENSQAMLVLDAVIDLAALRDQLYDVRRLIMTKGDIQKQNGDADEAMRTYNRLVSIYADREPDKLLAETYKDMGDCYKMKQDADSGMVALSQALEIFERLGEDREIARTYNNMGNLHWFKGAIDQSRLFFRKALKKQRRLGADEDVASTLNNLGGSYAVVGNYQRGYRLYSLSLEKHRQLGKQDEIARNLNNIGYLWSVIGEGQKAVEALDESLEINRRIGSKKEILFNLLNLGEAMIRAGQLRQSLPYFQEGLSLAQSLSDSGQFASCQLLTGNVYQRLGKIRESAVSYHTVSHVLNDIDDPHLPIDLLVHNANLRLLVGDANEALDLARKAVAQSKQCGHATAHLSALLLIARLSTDAQIVADARDIISEDNLIREALILRFHSVEALLAERRFEEAVESARKLMDVGLGETEDIETAGMATTLAEALIHDNDYDHANHYLAIAERFSRANGLLPEMMTCLTLQGRISLETKDYETAFTKFKNGLQVCKKIVESIECPEDREQFQTRRDVAYLVLNIKNLSKLLTRR